MNAGAHVVACVSMLATATDDAVTTPQPPTMLSQILWHVTPRWIAKRSVHHVSFSDSFVVHQATTIALPHTLQQHGGHMNYGPPQGNSYGGGGYPGGGGGGNFAGGRGPRDFRDFGALRDAPGYGGGGPGGGGGGSYGSRGGGGGGGFGGGGFGGGARSGGSRSSTNELGFHGSLHEDPVVEAELFGNAHNSGINFDKYDDIPVETSGDGCPEPLLEFNAEILGACCGVEAEGVRVAFDRGTRHLPMRSCCMQRCRAT